jgi:hypothetical protein
MYDPKDVVKLYLYGWIHEPDTVIAAAGNGKQTKSGSALATAHPLPGSQNDSRVPAAKQGGVKECIQGICEAMREAGIVRERITGNRRE